MKKTFYEILIEFWVEQFTLLDNACTSLGVENIFKVPIKFYEASITIENVLIHVACVITFAIVFRFAVKLFKLAYNTLLYGFKKER